MKLAMKAACMGSWVWDIADDKVTYSDELRELLKLSPSILHHNRQQFLNAVHPQDRVIVDGVLQHAIIKGQGSWVEFRVMRSDGSACWMCGHGKVIRDVHGKALKMIGVAIDITQKKQSELILDRAKRAQRTLSAVNYQLTNATEEKLLLNAVCQVIVEIGGYKMAWVGYAMDDEYQSVQPVARCGDDHGDLDDLKFTWSNTEFGGGPTGMAIRTGMAQVNQNYLTNPNVASWRERAGERGYGSSIAFPLGDVKNIHGGITIYAAEQDAFNTDEVALLQELADDLTFGIVTVRTRAERNKMVVEHLQHESVLRQSLIDSIKAIAAMVEMRDPYTAGHESRVADLAVAIASEIGLPEERIQGLRLASLIHDVGKIKVPAEILTKPGRLDPVELALIKMHPQSGNDILKDVHFPWPIARMVYEHHERIDGTGYPNCLRGDQILLESKILTVADVVEAMYAHRPYRAGLGIDAALEEVAAHCGVWYDKAICEACIKIFREGRFSFVQ